MSKKLIEKFMKDEIVEGEIKLTLTTPINELPINEQEALGYLYNSRDIGMRLFGTLLNSSLTQGRVVFIITRRLMSYLIKADVNTKKNSVDTKSYQTLLNRIITCGYVRRTREATNGKAGLYEIVNEDLLMLLGTKIKSIYIEAQKQKTYEWYDNNDIKEKVVVEEEDPIIAQAQRGVIEKRRRDEQEVHG